VGLITLCTARIKSVIRQHLQELCPPKGKENSEELELELELAPARCESGLVPPKVSIKSFCLVKEVWERTDK